jgi:hypothetical protein
VASIDDLFVDDETGAPQLIDCGLLYVDLLGVSAMTESRDPQQELIDLHGVLRGSFRDYHRSSEWIATMFSDLLVIATPADGAEVLSGLIHLGARLQLDLALKGFFLRGGFSVGLFHNRDDIVFGPALVESYRLEQDHAANPRVVLSEHAAEYLEGHDAPLLIDQDGRAFIDYLAPAFDDASIDIDTQLRKHRSVIAQRLKQHRSESGLWEKYRWAADYHNDFCRRKRRESPKLLIDVGASDKRFSKFS